jgi:hypothetical protein
MSQSRTSNLFLFIVVFALIALPAAAADNGFYLGGSFGYSDITTGELNQFSVEGDATGYKIFGGARFLHVLALEASWVDFGTINDTRNDIEAEIDGYGLQGVVLLPLGIADIFGKAGVFQWNADFQGPIINPNSASNDGTDPVYGAGVQFRIKSWAIRGEVEYYDVQDAKSIYMYSIGGSYTF